MPIEPRRELPPIATSSPQSLNVTTTEPIFNVDCAQEKPRIRPTRSVRDQGRALTDPRSTGGRSGDRRNPLVLPLKRALKRYDKVCERFGRLRQKYARVAQYYDITVTKEPTSGNVGAIEWQRTQRQEDTLPGVLPTHQPRPMGRGHTVAHLYTMLTAGSGVSRS